MDHTHSTSHHQGEVLVGITRDAVLRPVGIIMAIVGAMWGLFIGMAVEAGTYKEPMAAAALFFLGIVLAGLGKETEQV